MNKEKSLDIDDLKIMSYFFLFYQNVNFKNKYFFIFLHFTVDKTGLLNYALVVTGSYLHQNIPVSPFMSHLSLFLVYFDLTSYWNNYLEMEKIIWLKHSI